MTHLERFLATVERRTVDYPASWLGLPHPDALPALYAHFGVSSPQALKEKVNDDVFPVELPYHSPTSDAIYAAFDFAKDRRSERTLTAPGFFEDFSDPADVDKFAWPDPAKYIDPALCRKVVDEVPARGYAVMGVLWSAHFQDACAAFGMESALMKMLTEPAMFQAVIDRITEFYLRANEIFFEATKGKLHAVLFGNDFGSQAGLMVSPELLRRHVGEGSRRIIAQAKRYGLKVVYHSCGAIHDIIPDLIALGADVVHPIQALATKMEPQRLKADFAATASFCGGVDAQYLLVEGTPAQVRQKVRELKALFPTGLVISPSHEAILPDIPPANVEALFDEVHPHSATS
ncbi:MAG: uroporphyrinogen decarboxylase family protein [Prevotellaceae bacterium]|jgi:uroporphyrinogen decarboxylase|nr:uroporphyrinogen decarboxylase family protein [Prevotellaceae bacterium]